MNSQADLNLSELSKQNILNRAEAAAYLRISVSKLDVLVRHGEIKPKRFGRRVIFPRSVLDEWAGQLQPAV